MMKSELNIYNINNELSILSKKNEGQLDDCIQKCKEIYENCIKLSYNPGIAKSLSLWAKFESIKNNMITAQNLLERAYEYCKDEDSLTHYEILIHMSSCYIKEFKINEAATILTITIKELMKTTHYGLLCKSFYNFAELNKRIGNFETAKKNYLKILKFSDDNKIPRSLLLKVNYALGEIKILHDEEDINLNVVFSNPIKNDKPYLEVQRHYVMGQYYMAKGDQENALIAFKKAIDIEGVKGETWYVFLALKEIIQHSLNIGEMAEALMMFNYYNDIYNFSKTSFVMLNSLLLKAQILHMKGHYKEGSQILYDYINYSNDIFLNQAGESLNQSLKYNVLLEETKNHQLNSITDALTGLGNRRGFNERLALMIDKYRQRKIALKLSLILLDLDYFKQYNDLIGHLKGDELLKAIGKLLLEVEKDNDVRIFRYGGDEFIAIGFCEADHSYYSLAENIRQSIEKLGIQKARENNGKVKAVTVSIGLLEIISDSQLIQEELIAQVDKALYASKKENRNKTTIISQ